MSKILVKLHEGSLLDLFANKQYIMADRPRVVVSSSLVQSVIAKGKMTLLGKLKDDASDEGFVKVLRKVNNDHNKAVDTYLKTWGEKAAAAPAPNREPESNGNDQ